MRAIAAALALSMVASADSQALAQTLDQQWSYCEDSNDQFSLDLQIGGCTAVIQSGSQTTQGLAVAFANRGASYAGKQDYQRAIADFDEALRLNPSLANTYKNRAIVYVTIGNNDRAITDFGEVIRLDPQNVNAYYDRGGLHYAKHDYARATADFDRVIQLRPNDAEAYYWRGLSLIGLGKKAEGEASIAKAKALNPNVGS